MNIRSAEKYVQVKLGITIQLKVCLARAMHGAVWEYRRRMLNHISSQGGGVG